MKTAERLRNFLSSAKRGEAFHYHLGLLAFDRSPRFMVDNNGNWHEVAPGDQEAHEAGLVAYAMAMDGKVHLVQEKVAESHYIYYAVKR